MPGPRRPKPGVERGDLGELLRQLRVAKNLKQRELASRSGVSRSHIASIETGGDTPGREVLHALASALGVTMDYLQTGNKNCLPARVVQDHEGLALLALWDQVAESERPRIIRILRAALADQ